MNVLLKFTHSLAIEFLIFLFFHINNIIWVSQKWKQVWITNTTCCDVFLLQQYTITKHILSLTINIDYE